MAEQAVPAGSMSDEPYKVDIRPDNSAWFHGIEREPTDDLYKVAARLNAQHAEIERLKAGLTDEQIAAGIIEVERVLHGRSEWEVSDRVVPEKYTAAFRHKAYAKQEPTS